MGNNDIENAELMAELIALRQRVTELEARHQELELKLNDSETRYQHLIDQSPLGIAIHCEGMVVYANTVATRILGANNPAEIIGRPTFDFIHPDNYQMMQERGQKIIEESWHAPLIEQKLVRLDKSLIDVETVGMATTYQGKPAILGILSDITHRKKAETALEEAEARYRTLVEQLPAITYIVEIDDQGGQTIYISPQVKTLLGFTQEEWIADRNLWIKQLHPADKERVVAAVKHKDISGEALDLEYRVLTADNRVVWFRNKQTTLRDEAAGQPRYTHGIMLDITEQKRLEEQLYQTQRLEALGQMAGGVAHNFNNVLTALIGHTELALLSLPPEHPAFADMEAVRRSAQRAAGLTYQLLAFTRHQVVYPITLKLNELLVNMEPILRQLLSDTIELLILPSPNLGQVKVDAAQIEQVIINLVLNARDAMPDSGRLTIETANITLDAGYVSQHTDVFPGDYVMLSVSDTGIGMTQEVKAHIFEPFFTTKEVGKGTGLGLSAAFGIVKQNGGNITVYSEPTQGTTIKIYLPRFYNNSSDKPAQNRAKEETILLPKTQRTILLVEDEPIVRELALRILNQQDYQVLVAKNGQEALNLVQSQPGQGIDLLITDVGLPQMGGDILAKHLQTMYPSLKIIFMSGYTEKAIAQRGVLSKNIEVISKPFSPRVFLEKVRSTLEV
jgi:PAS domain S-box-containing protein